MLGQNLSIYRCRFLFQVGRIAAQRNVQTGQRNGQCNEAGQAMTHPTCNPVVSCQWTLLPWGIGGGQHHPPQRLVPSAKLPKRLAAISIIPARFVLASILLEGPALQGVTEKIRTRSQWRHIGYVSWLSSIVCILGFAFYEFPSRATDRPMHVAMGTACPVWHQGRSEDIVCIKAIISAS